MMLLDYIRKWTAPPPRTLRDAQADGMRGSRLLANALFEWAEFEPHHKEALDTLRLEIAAAMARAREKGVL